MIAPLLGLMLLLPSITSAATLYVNNSGLPACSNDTVKASNSAEAPWCNIMRATRGSNTYGSPSTSEAASAGDVVLVTAGTYWENGRTTADSSSRWSVALNPANSGTSGNPITIRGVGDVYVRLNENVYGPMIGCDSKDYIVWDHLNIDDYYGGSAADTQPGFDTGPAVFHVAVGCQLINSTVAGHTGSYHWGYATYTDNYNAVRVEYADAMTIKNNTIHRVHNHGTGVGNENSAGIMTYSMTNSFVEHNEVYDCGTGIYIKGVTAALPQEDNDVRYNYVHDNDRFGIKVSESTRTRVYQNVVTNTQTAGDSGGIALGANADTVSVVNNTLYGNTLSFTIAAGVGAGAASHKNNIVQGGTRAVWNPGGITPSTFNSAFDRNLYNGPTIFGEIDGSTYNFAAFQGTYTQDTNGVNGSNPLFVNAGGSFALATDFKLQSAGQTALTLGRVVESIGGTNGATIPAGAYITGSEEIGLELTAGGTPEPTVRRFMPFNLRR